MTGISNEAQQLKLTLRRDTLDYASLSERRADWESAARLATIADGVKLDVCHWQGIACEI